MNFFDFVYKKNNQANSNEGEELEELKNEAQTLSRGVNKMVLNFKRDGASKDKKNMGSYLN